MRPWKMKNFDAADWVMAGVDLVSLGLSQLSVTHDLLHFGR